MRRTIATLVASLALLVGGLQAPLTVAAASYGSCGDFVTAHYLSGYQTTLSHLQGVSGTLRAPSGSFSPCQPNDYQGTNGPTVLLSLENHAFPYIQTAWVQVGILRCSNGPQYCNGGLTFFSEWREGLTGATLVHTYGSAIYDVDATVYLLTNHAAGTVDVYINWTRVDQWHVDGQIDGSSQTLVGKWITETHDRGDGVGTNSPGEYTLLGNVRSLIYGGQWAYRQTGCNFNSGSQIVCQKNGNYGLAFYTAN